MRWVPVHLRGDCSHSQQHESDRIVGRAQKKQVGHLLGLRETQEAMGRQRGLHGDKAGSTT